MGEILKNLNDKEKFEEIAYLVLNNKIKYSEEIVFIASVIHQCGELVGPESIESVRYCKDHHIYPMYFCDKFLDIPLYYNCRTTEQIKNRYEKLMKLKDKYTKMDDEKFYNFIFMGTYGNLDSVQLDLYNDMLKDDILKNK